MLRARRLLFVTGAGVSAESGLPTYRGVGGLYEGERTEFGMSIEEALSGPTFAQRPDVTWSAIRQIEERCRGARPNIAHEWIARAHREWAPSVVLTQNVDGFHRVAGSPEIIDIHGDLHDLRCTRCPHAWTVNDYRELEPVPHCPRCGAVVRPDVVLFEEMLPEAKLLRLREELAAGYDVVFSIGTTSVFAYIAAPVRLAEQFGALSVEINPDRSEVSDAVDVRWTCAAGEGLSALARAVEARREGGGR